MFHKKEYVYEVYKTKNFSKAASNLFISQPALSACIKKIEQHLGTPIFDRSTTPLGLTQCGEKYIQYIEQIMAMEMELEKDLNDLKNLKTGHITIGGSNLFSSYILPSLISTFKNMYPGIEVKLVEANSKSLEKQLFQGNIDLVLDNCDFSEQLYSRYFFCEEQLLLAVPASFASNSVLQSYQLTFEDIKQNKHSNPTQKIISLTNFAKDPFLLLRSGNDTRYRSELLLKQAQVTPNVVLKLDQQATAYHVASHGMGITFVADTLIKQLAFDPNMVFYKLEESLSHRNIYFYRKKGKYVTYAIHEFLKHYATTYEAITK